MSDIRLLKITEKRLDILKLMNIESLEDMMLLKKHIPHKKMIKSLLKGH